MNNIFQYFCSKKCLIKAHALLHQELFLCAAERDNYRASSESNKKSVHLLKIDRAESGRMADDFQGMAEKYQAKFESEQAANLRLIEGHERDRAEWIEREDMLLLCLAEEKRRAASYKGKYNRLKKG